MCGLHCYIFLPYVRNECKDERSIVSVIRSHPETVLDNFSKVRYPAVTSSSSALVLSLVAAERASRT